MRAILLALVLGMVVSAFLLAPAPRARSAPKRDGEGLAAKYPNDKGIMKDRSVLFWDNFERTDFKRWDENQHPAGTFLTRKKGQVHAGKQSVVMIADVPRSTGGGLIKWFSPGVDRMFARFYVMFPKDANYVHHFVHIVGGRDRWSGFGKAGMRPNGTDFFTTGIEPSSRWGRVPPPGVWHFYTYWPDMKGSPGRYWGNDFSPSKPIPIPREKWMCVEMMVKCNTPGEPDGEQAFWINGKLAGHYKGIRWRTTPNLKANAFWLLYYVTPAALRRSRSDRLSGRFSCFFDDVVVATKYIGPMVDKSKPKKKNKYGKFVVPPGFETK